MADKVPSFEEIARAKQNLIEMMEEKLLVRTRTGTAIIKLLQELCEIPAAKSDAGTTTFLHVFIKRCEEIIAVSQPKDHTLNELDSCILKGLSPAHQSSEEIIGGEPFMTAVGFAKKAELLALAKQLDS